MGRPTLPPKRETALAVAARTYAGASGADGIYYSNEIVNNLGYGKLVIRTMPTAEVATSTFDLKVQAYDEITATWYDIAGASLVQITADRTTPIDLIIGAGLTAVANRVVSSVVPKRSRVKVTLGSSTTDGFTFGIETELHQT